MFRIALGPDRQPFLLDLPMPVVLGLFSRTYADRPAAQVALDELAETIELNNPGVSASPGLHALEVDDVACYHIEEL